MNKYTNIPRINTMNNIYIEYTVAHNSYNTEVKIQVHRIIDNKPM